MDEIWFLLQNTYSAITLWLYYLLELLQFLFNGMVTLATSALFDEGVNTSIFSKLQKFFKLGWIAGLGGLISKLLSWIQKLQDFLKKHLAGVIAFLTKLRAWFDRYYKLHILPIINLIQRIRKFLLILRLLHIHIADALDKKLSQYEALLNGVFLKVRGYLNLALSMGSLATNPISLGRLVLVSIATRRAMGALVRGVTGLPLGHFFPSANPKAFAWEKAPTSSASYTDLALNPPASEILAPLLSSFAEGSYLGDAGPEDIDVDSTETLLYGDDLISQLVASEATVAAIETDDLSLRQLVVEQTGLLYATGQAAAGSLLGWLQT